PGETGTDEQGSSKGESEERQLQISPFYNRMFSFKDEKGFPYSQTKYYALMSDGTKISGTTDENGNTKIFSGNKIDNIRVHLAI
ncbi:hypothetical protein UXO13_22575, partial [Enterobacter bugandensis]